MLEENALNVWEWMYCDVYSVAGEFPYKQTSVFVCHRNADHICSEKHS